VAKSAFTVACMSVTSNPRRTTGLAKRGSHAVGSLTYDDFKLMLKLFRAEGVKERQR